MWPNPQFPVIIHQSISFKSFPNPTKNIPRILLICKKKYIWPYSTNKERAIGELCLFLWVNQTLKIRVASAAIVPMI